MILDPQRTVAELKELRALTGDENGAQRVAWTDTWLKARGWFQAKIKSLPVQHHYDAAGNSWTTLPGESEKALLIGGHRTVGCIQITIYYMGTSQGIKELTDTARSNSGAKTVINVVRNRYRQLLYNTYCIRIRVQGALKSGISLNLLNEIAHVRNLFINERQNGSHRPF